MLDQANRVLSKVFGFDGFRPGQEEIIAAILRGDDVFAVMPTGSDDFFLTEVTLGFVKK